MYVIINIYNNSKSREFHIFYKKSYTANLNLWVGLYAISNYKYMERHK